MKCEHLVHAGRHIGDEGERITDEYSRTGKLPSALPSDCTTVIFVARWIAVPYTLGLVIVGLVLGVAGVLPEVQLTPPLVLFVFCQRCSLKGPGQFTRRWSVLIGA